jgi:ABC-type transport system involved in multi-copper enzyme maturation permease subunit
MLLVSIRRMRQESMGIMIALLGVGLIALITGMKMSNEFHASGLADCLAAKGDCNDLSNEFGDKFNSLQFLIVPLVLMPALLGAFVGAPLVARELESGTHRFLWTQGVTRQRWFVFTAGAALAAAALAGVIYAVIAARWLDITNEVTGERFGQLYDFQGVIPIAASVFAVAVGIACGILIRRTVPAMAATLGIFIVVRVVTGVVLRPHFAAAKTISYPAGPTNPLEQAGAWILSERTLDAAGHEVGRNGSINVGGFIDQCPNIRQNGEGMPKPEDIDKCLGELGVHTVFKYHPASRFWTFQLIESGLLLGLGAVAIGVAFVALRRRPA